MKDWPIWTILSDTAMEWKRDKVPWLAAALAFYTIFSLSPLLIIATVIAGGVLGQETVKARIITQVSGGIGTYGAQIVESLIENASHPGAGTVAAVISAGIMLFGASNLFAQLQDAINTIWNVQAKPGRGVFMAAKVRGVAFLLVVAAGVMLWLLFATSVILSAMTRFFGDLLPGVDFPWQVVNQLGSFALVTVLFALLLKGLSDVKIDWKDVWVGAMVTSLLFNLGNFLIVWYLGRSNIGLAYGAAGSFALFLLWVYYSAQIFFFGVEFTKVYTRYCGRYAEPRGYVMRVAKSIRVDPDQLPEGHED